MSALAVSQVLSWIVIAGLVILVAALARQIGLLHERIAPVGALMTDTGPEVGQTLPRFEMRTLDDAPAIVGGRAQEPLRLLLFVAADCPICKRVIPLARRVADAEGVALTLVGDGATAPLLAMRTRLGLEPVRFVHGPEIGLALRIGKLPYAVLVDGDAVIRGKGLVNSREHLESLLVANETGHDSVQSYLRERERSDAAD